MPHPLEWLTDNGCCYTAKETRAFASSLGFVVCTTPVRSPQSNGMAEAFVKTLKPSLQRRLYRAVLSAATECPSLVQDVDASATRLLSTQMAVVQPEHAEAFHLSVRSPLVGACVSGCASRPLRHR